MPLLLGEDVIWVDYEGLERRLDGMLLDLPAGAFGVWRLVAVVFVRLEFLRVETEGLLRFDFFILAVSMLSLHNLRGKCGGRLSNKY